MGGQASGLRWGHQHILQGNSALSIPCSCIHLNKRKLWTVGFPQEEGRVDSHPYLEDNRREGGKEGRNARIMGPALSVFFFATRP